MKKSKQAKAREFSATVRNKIKERDGGKCIFCTMGYRLEANWYEKNMLSIMHYIPRSRNGLGIEENGAVGCVYHHAVMDNGAEGVRKEMLEMFRNYLRRQYPDWDEENLVYQKWKI